MVSSASSSKWLLLVLLNSLLIQGATYVVRPMVTFRLVEWGANAALVGLIGALYALAPLIFAIQLGRWVDRGRAGTALFVGSAVAIAASTLILLSTEVLLLAFAMPLLGMGHLLTMVGGQTLIAKQSPDKSYERNFGLLTFYASMGQAVGPLIGGILADQGATIDTGTPIAMAIAIFCVAALASIPLVKRGEVAVVESEPEQGLAAVKGLLNTPNFKSALFVSASITAVVDVVTIFMPLLGKQVGLGALQIGLLLAARSAAAMVIRLILGYLNNKLGPRNLINLGSVLTMLCCLALVAASDYWLLMVIMVVAGMSMAIGQPASMAWISRITSADRRGLAISVRLTSNRFGQVVVPMIAGVIAGGGVGPVFALLAALQAGSWLVTSRSMPKL